MSGNLELATLLHQTWRQVSKETSFKAEPVSFSLCDTSHYLVDNEGLQYPLGSLPGKTTCIITWYRMLYMVTVWTTYSIHLETPLNCYTS